MEIEELDLITNDIFILRLKKILDYELSSSLLLFLSFFVSIAIYLSILASIIFIPYLIFALYKNHKYGWLSFLIVIIIIPSSLLFFLETGSNNFYAIVFIEIILFYLYCFILRFATNEWVEKNRNKKILELSKRKKTNI